VKGVFQVTSQEGNVMARMEIKSDSQIKFDKSRHSIVWAVVSSDGSFHSLEFVFESPDEEIEFKKLLAIKIFEASRQEAFKTAIESVSSTMRMNILIIIYRRQIKTGLLMLTNQRLEEVHLTKVIFAKLNNS
jgi:hypothetical protein